MQVAIFTDNDFAKVNGVTTTLKAVLRHAPTGFEPRVYTAADTGTDRPDYFAVRSWGVGLPWYRNMRVYWPRLRRLADQLTQDNVRVVHVTTPGPVGLAGRWLARRLGLPLMGSYHTQLGRYVDILSGSTRLGWLMDRYMRWFYGACDPVLVPSLAMLEDLKRTRGYRPERLRVWGRGVDSGCFHPAKRSAALREQWAVDDRRPAVLFGGRISREKGLELISPIQAALDRRGVAHQFVFAGDGPYQPGLRAACPRGVHLGSVTHDDMAVVMASADVFLFPSATDSLGNVVLEAQASGLPVLVSDRGGPHEQILADETGFVAAAGNAESFVRPLMSLLADPERRARMGEAARRHMLHRDWPHAHAPLAEAWRTARGSHLARTQECLGADEQIPPTLEVHPHPVVRRQ